MILTSNMMQTYLGIHRIKLWSLYIHFQHITSLGVDLLYNQGGRNQKEATPRALAALPPPPWLRTILRAPQDLGTSSLLLKHFRSFTSPTYNLKDSSHIYVLDDTPRVAAGHFAESISMKSVVLWVRKTYLNKFYSRVDDLAYFGTQANFWKTFQYNLWKLSNLIL
jgi:hypothetical protein